MKSVERMQRDMDETEQEKKTLEGNKIWFHFMYYLTNCNVVIFLGFIG